MKNDIKKEALQDLIQYIYDLEHDDFIENYSENHIYFKALVLDMGLENARIEAQKMLEEKPNQQQ